MMSFALKQAGLALLTIVFIAGFAAAYVPVGDLDSNGQVDLADMGILVENWLRPDCAGPDCGELDGLPGVTLGDFSLLSRNWLVGMPIISEFMAQNDTTLPTTFTPGGSVQYPDWIEIHNTNTESSFDLGGWYLTDNQDVLTQWAFPAGVTIQPDDYLVIFASGQDLLDPQGYYHTNFQLDKDGDYLALVSPGLSIVHEYTPQFPQQSKDVSFGLGRETTATTTLIPSYSLARYWKPTSSALGLTWTQTSFNDSAWSLGNTGLGYEGSPADFKYLIKTTIPAGTVTIYLRQTFTVEAGMSFDQLVLKVKYDDGFIAYLNGVEVARSAHTPHPPQWNSTTTDNYNHPDSQAIVFEEYDISDYIGLLQPGSSNVLAIHGLNVVNTSSDMLILPELVGVSNIGYARDIPMYFNASTPGQPNGQGYPQIEYPRFSRSESIFIDSFDLTLSADSPTAVIRYTLDGSEPTASSAVYSSPIPISTTTTIKAAVYEPGVGRGQTSVQRYAQLNSDVRDFNSNLPIVVLDTFGSAINADTYTTCFATVIDTDPVTGRAAITDLPGFSGRSAIKFRGSSTLLFAKKSMSLEIRNENDEDKNVSLLGLPSESDWVLYSSFMDKSLMRDVLVYQWSNECGRYAPRTRFVEVFLNTDSGDVRMDSFANVTPYADPVRYPALNGGCSYPGDYMGVYVLIEKIKRDEYRVDVEKLEPYHNSEPEISGGYLIKNDRVDPGDKGFRTSRGEGFLCPMVYVDPKEAEITPQQAAWLYNYTAALDNVLVSANFSDPVAGYSQYIDVGSFIDYELMVELAKNPDGYIFSTFLFKDRSGKIHMGPQWDYNLTLGNANWVHCNYTYGWYTVAGRPDLGNYCIYQWTDRLHDDPEFMVQWWDRWFELRKTVWNKSKILNDIDGYAQFLDEAQQRNFQRWPILGVKVNADIYGEYFVGATYQEEIDHMKGWITDRINWIDSQSPYNTPPAFVQNENHVPAGQPVPMASGGVLNGSLKLDGAGDYVTMTGYKGISGTQSRTVSAWINTETTGVIVSWGREETGKKWTFRVQDYVGTMGAVRLEVGHGWMVGETDVHDGRWHHVAVVLDSDGTPNTDELQLYVDGRREVPSNIYPQAIDTVAEADVKIGAFIGFPEYFNGRIDDVRIYDRALTDTEIAAMANLLTPPASGLVGHWKLDETLGTVVADSAASHTGAITGNPLWQPAQTIYYTLDGSDPRQRGGAVSPAAYNYTTDGPPLLTENTTIRARTYAASKWSTLLEEDFLIDRGVVINEFMALNNTTLEDPDEPGEYPDWIEFFNNGTDPVNLGGMYLTDKLDNPTKWRIAAGITLPPGDYLLFWADDDGTQGPYHTNFKLDQYGEAVALFAADGVTLIDQVKFGDQFSDVSYGRSPDGSVAWGFLQTPTPQYENSSIQSE